MTMLHVRRKRGVVPLRSFICILLLAAAAAITTPHAATPIEASGGLDASAAWVGNTVGFWLRIRNNDTVPSQLRFQVVGTGLTLVAFCTPLSGSDSSPCQKEATVTIDQASERLLGGALEVVDSGDYRVTLQGVDTRGSVIAVPLGSLSATSRAWSVIEWLKNLGISLTLPIVLAFLGYKYQSRLQQEQDDRKGREQTQADERAKIEKALAERATSVRLMLPIVHQYAIRYYVDLAGSYTEFAKYANVYADSVKNAPADQDSKEAAETGERALNEATYRFIKLNLIHREFYQHVGGLYLATRFAEDILIAAFARLAASLLPPGEPTITALVKMLDALQEPPATAGAMTATPAREHDTSGVTRMRVLNRAKLEQFLGAANAATKQAHDTIKARLKSWLDQPGHEDGLNCAQLYGDVLNHEMDLALQQWYRDDVAKLDVSEYGKLGEEICEQLGPAKERALVYLGLRPEPRGTGESG